MKIKTSQLKQLIREQVRKVVEGGEGSGIKGHKTAEDPKQKKDKKLDNNINNLITQKNIKNISKNFEEIDDKNYGSVKELQLTSGGDLVILTHPGTLLTGYLKKISKQLNLDKQFNLSTMYRMSYGDEHAYIIEKHKK